MDMQLKQTFMEKWEQYFGDADLPFVFFYSDDEKYAENLKPVDRWVCMIAQLAPVLRKGKTLSFTKDTFGCFGGTQYCGFPIEDNPVFKYFLSYGIPGEVEGERYKKTPELVAEYMADMPVPPAEGKYIVFKRWDTVEEGEDALTVVFFAPPDVISGLFTLANFAFPGQEGVISPFCSGCGSIISYPLSERERDEPRAVVGMFDVSARPFVKDGVLSFAAPMKKLEQMVADMDESFLITGSWERVSRRIAKKHN
jgi:hypothetical protein